jgi:hypothetical protein
MLHILWSVILFILGSLRYVIFITLLALRGGVKLLFNLARFGGLLGLLFWLLFMYVGYVPQQGIHLMLMISLILLFGSCAVQWFYDIFLLALNPEKNVALFLD